MSTNKEETIDARGPSSRRPEGLVPLKLVVVSGADQGKEVPFDVSAVIGADKACTLALNDRSVSRKHVELVRTASAVLVRDLGSRNGTSFGGARLTGSEEAALPHAG